MLCAQNLGALQGIRRLRQRRPEGNARRDVPGSRHPQTAPAALRQARFAATGPVMPDHGRIRSRLRTGIRAAHHASRQHLGHGAAAGAAGHAHPEDEVHQRGVRLPHRQHVRVLHSCRRGHHGLLLHAGSGGGEVRVRLHRHYRHRVLGHVLYGVVRVLDHGEAGQGHRAGPRC